MLYPHACHQSILLNSGQVLVLGGSGAEGTEGTDFELYSAQTGSFSLAGLSPERGDNTCQGSLGTVLVDGKVLIVLENGDARIYDPVTQAFTPTGVVQPDSYNDGLPTATLLADDTVLVTGGFWDGGVYNTLTTFDETLGAFTLTGYLKTDINQNTSTLLSDGTVLLAGSCFGVVSPLSVSYVYAPATRTFSQLSMLTPRCQHTATLLNDGQVLLAGGSTSQYATTANAELYQPATIAPAAACFRCPETDRVPARSSMRRLIRLSRLPIPP